MNNITDGRILIGINIDAMTKEASERGKKLNLLYKNSNVCFEMEENSEIIKKTSACEWTSSFKSIVGFGKIEIITDYKEKVDGLNIIMKHYGAPKKNVFNTKHVEAIVILKLKITEMTGKISKNLVRHEE